MGMWSMHLWYLTILFQYFSSATKRPRRQFNASMTMTMMSMLTGSKSQQDSPTNSIQPLTSPFSASHAMRKFIDNIFASGEVNFEYAACRISDNENPTFDDLESGE